MRLGRSVRAGALAWVLALAGATPLVAQPANLPPRGGVDRRSPLVLAVERASPAVVNISTEALVQNPYYGRRQPFDWFFGGMPRQPREQYVANSLGSGVIVDPEGYVVTNEHVVAAASRITVTFPDGRQVGAEMVGSASEYDLAVLRLSEDGPFPYLPVTFNEELYPGETVIAIGNPFGLQNSVTAGILSSTHRTAESGGSAYTDFLQTDAAINPGNSGGALLTVNGDLIGINTQIDARGQNLGFAIPVARVRKVFSELVQHGNVRDAWLGAEFSELEMPDRSGRLARAGAAGGLVFSGVLDGGPAARAGVLAGDVLVAVAATPVRDHQDLHTALSRLSLGDEFELSLLRDGSQVRTRLRAEAFPLERGADLCWKHLGLALEARTARGGRHVAVIADVRRDSAAADIGLRPGFVVFWIDSTPVDEPEDLYRALTGALSRRSVLLGIAGNGGTYRVPLPVE